MTPETLARLRSLAEAARDEHMGGPDHWSDHAAKTPQCAAFIAAIDPQTLFDLLDAAELSVALRETASRLEEAIGNEAAVKGLLASGHLSGWKVQMDAENETLCALQDTRTVLDGRERPHTHFIRRVATIV